MKLPSLARNKNARSKTGKFRSPLSRRLAWLFVFIATPVLALNTFRGAIDSLGPGSSGLKSGRQMVSLWHNLLANLSFDGPTRSFISFFRDSLDNFDFEQLHKSAWLNGRRKGYHTITFAGQNQPNQYLVRWRPGNYLSNDFSKLGNFGAEFGLKHNAESKGGGPSYSGEMFASIALKQFSHKNGTLYLDEMLKVIDPGNMGQIKASSSTVFPNLKGHSRKIVDQMALELPNLALMFQTYTRAPSLLTVREDSSGRQYTDFHLRGVLRVDDFEDDYPELAEYLDDVRDFFKFKFYLTNKKGQILTSFLLDPSSESIVWKFKTAGGKVLPYDWKGNPTFEDGFRFQDLKDYTFFVNFNFYSNFHGLKFNTGNIVIRGHYHRDPKAGTLSFQITKIPDIKVSGFLYHMVPKWLIDVSIPGNIDELVARFTKTLIYANNGDGSKMYFSWNTKNPSDVYWNIYGCSEFLDNRFVRIGLKIWNKKFIPRPEAFEQGRKFLSNFSGALVSDLDAMR